MEFAKVLKERVLRLVQKSSSNHEATNEMAVLDTTKNDAQLAYDHTGDELRVT